MEKAEKGSGGLLTININPYTCKGCMECVDVCNDKALVPQTQTEESVRILQQNWEFWQDLPDTNSRYIRIDDLEEGIGALETLLLNKNNYLSIVSGDGACLGCAEKTVLHLFTATVTALMQKRVVEHLEKVNLLTLKLEEKIKSSLTPELKDTGILEKILNSPGHTAWTRSEISAELEEQKVAIDSEKLKVLAHLVNELKQIQWRYATGTSGKGRSSMGMINATGCSSVWGSTYPINPYPFPDQSSVSG